MGSEYMLHVIANGLVSIFGSGCATWIIQHWLGERLKNEIKSDYDQKLETHKAKLKAESDLEVEKLRSQLSLIAKEHEVVFSKLHEKRAEIIAKFYSKLNLVHVRLTDYVNPFERPGGPTKDELFRFLVDAHKEFSDLNISSAIFLPAKIDHKIGELNKELLQIGNEFTEMVRTRSTPNYMKRWVEIEQRCSGPIKVSLADLAKEFRRLLGDKDPEP